MLKRVAIYIMLLFSIALAEGKMSYIVVADSVTRMPLPNASVYDRNGKAVGMGDGKGRIHGIRTLSYPLTIRYVGFKDKKVLAGADTVFLQEDFSDLPEFVVESRRQKFLHILAYVREYSTLSSYTDTIFLFREKMVDFMLPTDRKMRFKGWNLPRILTSRSYVRFSNANGLDSVSDAVRHHFSWSDWMELPPGMKLPAKLRNVRIGQDTVCGKYSPAEIWSRDKGHVSVGINVLADMDSRRWVPNFSGFFSQNVDFEKFRMSADYDNVIADSITSFDIVGYSYHIESNGRGRDMFMFHKVDEPFFVSTEADVYVLDKEFITVKEAKKWYAWKFDEEEIDIYEPQDAPALAPDIRRLIARVDNIDRNRVRLDFTPDRRYVSQIDSRKNFTIGHRALNILKQVTGISYFKSHRNFNRRWDEFRKSRNKK